MMARRNRRGVVWAVVGGLILVAGIVALIISAVTSGSREPDTTLGSSAPIASSTATASTPTNSETVDDAVAERGWVPEPITTDAETYARAALSAASTFDTQLSTYEEWMTYLVTWFTYDTRYAGESDREDELAAAKLEFRQSVALPEVEWNSLANEAGRMASVVVEEVSLTPVPDDPAGDMAFVTSDIAITFTRSDGNGGEVSYEESTRLTVQVLCGPDSVAAPDSAQRAGDCKAVRYFAEPLEP